MRALQRGARQGLFDRLGMHLHTGNHAPEGTEAQILQALRRTADEHDGAFHVRGGVPLENLPGG